MLEGVNLKWNDFEDNLIRSFKDFRTVLNDVIIFCGQEKVYANKFVLCASSEVFRDMLVNCEISRQPQPAVILWDVDINLMNLILDFMYIGEVKISEGDLNDFLGLAKRLRVRGLVAVEPKEKQDFTKEKCQLNDNTQFNMQIDTNTLEGKRTISKLKLSSKEEVDQSSTPFKSTRLENSSDVYKDKEEIDLEEVLQNSQDTMVIKSSDQEIFTNQLSQNFNDQDSYLLHQGSVPDLDPLRVDTGGSTMDSFNNSIMDPLYKCNLCLKTYKTKGSLYNHMSLYHRGQKGE